jgi:hypothetical protein
MVADIQRHEIVNNAREQQERNPDGLTPGVKKKGKHQKNKILPLHTWNKEIAEQ